MLACFSGISLGSRWQAASHMADRPDLPLQETFPRFVAVGILATAVHYMVLIGAVEGLAVSPVPASGLGYSLGAMANYWLNRRFTFRSEAPHARAILRFSIVLATGLCLNLLLMHWLTGRFSLPYLWSQVITTGIVLVWNFIGNSRWSFA
jgi:putative flippase GtrA